MNRQTRILRTLRSCGLIVGLLIIASGRAVWAATYPAPLGRVNDFAHVLDASTVQRLEEALTELEQRTGAEVAVVTVPSVEGGDIERAAEELFRQWGIGKRRNDNGVLILCAVGDRRVRIEVGYGLEQTLPDAMCGRIIRERMAPHFKAGDYAAGLVDGTSAVVSLIAKAAGIAPSDVPLATFARPEASATGQGTDAGVIFVFFLFVLIIAVALQRRRSGWWGPVWGGSFGGHDRGWSGGGFSGDFGGFGGGSSGGGGACGSW